MTDGNKSNGEKRMLNRALGVSGLTIKILIGAVFALIALMWTDLGTRLTTIDERTLENRERIIRLEERVGHLTNDAVSLVEP